MVKYVVEVFNSSGEDWTVECDSDSDLKKMLRGDILEYTDCDDLHCLIDVDVDDVIANLKALSEYKIRGCDLTPKILIYRD